MSILDQALAEIAPAKVRKADCKDEIQYKIAVLRLMQTIQRQETSPGTVRVALRKITKHLRVADTAAKALPLKYWSLFLENHRRTIREWERETPFRRQLLAIEAAVNHMVVPPGGRRQSSVKIHAVKFARELLVEFDQKPTLTIDGHWPRLAAVLYEGAFGVSAEMFEYCRDYHNELNGRRRHKLRR